MVGNLGTHTGVSHMNRLLLQALDVADIPTLAVPLDDVPQARSATERLRAFRADVERIVVIASHTVDRLPLLAGFLAGDELHDAHRVALWHWEYTVAPDDVDSSRQLFDEFWAVSRHAAVALRQFADASVREFPVPIPGRRRPRPSKSAVGWSERFTFLTVFDHLSLAARKNPAAVIRAFQMAFPSPAEAGPQLVVKSRSADRMPAVHAELEAAVGERPDVKIIEAALADDAQSDLIAAADVLVSLHRAEGYGLTLAEAMGAGTIAMGTAWSGNLDFMSDRNSVLIPFHLTPTPPGLWNVPVGAYWAEPDVAAAATAMQRLAADADWRDTLRHNALHDVADHHSFERTAVWLREVLAETVTGHSAGPTR